MTPDALRRRSGEAPLVKINNLLDLNVPDVHDPIANWIGYKLKIMILLRNIKQDTSVPF
jgi:hypothetical protein